MKWSTRVPTVTLGSVDPRRRSDPRGNGAKQRGPARRRPGHWGRGPRSPPAAPAGAIDGDPVRWARSVSPPRVSAPAPSAFAPNPYWPCPPPFCSTRASTVATRPVSGVDVVDRAHGARQRGIAADDAHGAGRLLGPGSPGDDHAGRGLRQLVREVGDRAGLVGLRTTGRLGPGQDDDRPGRPPAPRSR